MRLSIVVLALLMLPAWGRSAPRAHTAREVLVVINSASADSVAIGEDYIRLRHVPNRVNVRCADSAVSTANETIALTDYDQQIEQPIRAFLKSHPSINFIVLTKGIPIRITGAALGSRDESNREPEQTRYHPCVDSYLAAMDYDKLPGLRRFKIHGSGANGAAYGNRYWNAQEPFSHQKFGGYLVTRLDGYTRADAMGLTRKALDAEARMSSILKASKVLLDVQPAFGLGDKATQPGPLVSTTIPDESAWSEFNADMRHAHDVLAQRSIPDELDLTEAFIGHRTDLLGYFSWGSNDAKYDPQAYQSLTFSPGSLCDTAVSTSARTFLPTQGGQSLLIDLIAHGLTCGKGYTDEPELQAIASPTIALERYTAGYTMAESLYAASHFVAWEDVVVGDPLCCPFAAPDSDGRGKAKR